MAVELVLSHPDHGPRRRAHAQDGRVPADFYATPPWVTESLLAYLQVTPSQGWQMVDSVLDPACGDGAILDVCKKAGRKTYGYEMDIERAGKAFASGHTVVAGDALLKAPWLPADAMIANFPYTNSMDFLREALAWSARLPNQPSVYMLQWSSFDEPTQERRELLVRLRPDKLILPRRVNFSKKGTYSQASAWFCWPGKGRMVWL